MTNKNKVIIGSAVGGVVLLGGIGTLAQSNNDDNSVSYSDDHIYTVNELCTRADTEQRFGSNHRDEVFTITGTIENKSYKSVYFQSDVEKSKYSKYRLECEFDDSNKIKDVSNDDTVTVSGKLYYLVSSTVTLKDCTLVAVSTPNDTSEDVSSTPTSSQEQTSSTGSSSAENSESSTISSSTSSSSGDSVSSTSTNSNEHTPSTVSSSAANTSSSTSSSTPAVEASSSTSATSPESPSGNNTSGSVTSSSTFSNPETPTIPKKDIVYIAASGNGKKYHKSPNCSSMNGNVIEMTTDEAKAAGYEPCKKKSCYG